MFLFRNKRLDKIEKQLEEIKLTLKQEQENNRNLTYAVTQIYKLIATIVELNSKF